MVKLVWKSAAGIKLRAPPTDTTNTPQPRDEGGEILLNDSKF